MASRDRWPFIATAILVLGYLLARAAAVPFVNDEARAFYMYVLSGEFLPFLASWDAANHPLLTALAQLSWKVSGMDPLGLRIWSVLAFVLYAWYAWRMGGWLRSRFVRWCLWAALLGAPFLLDFFALFRGYGLAMGFLLMALFHSARYMREERRTDLIAALVGMGLAGLAMLSLLIAWCGVFALLVLKVLRGKDATARYGRIAWCLFLGAVPLVLATVFLWELKSRGQLYYGTDAGIFDGTIHSLAIFVTGLGSGTWLVALCLPLAAAMLHGLWPLTGKRTTERDELARLAALLLAADILGHEFLFLTTGTLFPIDRGALHLVPFSIVLAACAIDRIAERRPAFALVAVPLLLLPMRSLALVNLDSTPLWGDNSIPARFHALVEERQRASDRPLIVAGPHLIREAWSFGASLRKNPSIALDPYDPSQPTCDLLILDTMHNGIPPGFRTIATTSTGQNSLLERERPLRMREVLDTTVTRSNTSEEFVTLWKPDAAAWRGRAAWVEVDAILHTPERLTGMKLVVDVVDTADTRITYRQVWTDHHRDGKDVPLHLAVRVPRSPPGTGHLTVYLYNPLKLPFQLDRAEVIVREVLPDEGLTIPAAEQTFSSDKPDP